MYAYVISLVSKPCGDVQYSRTGRLIRFLKLYDSYLSKHTKVCCTDRDKISLEMPQSAMARCPRDFDLLMLGGAPSPPSPSAIHFV